MHTGQLHYMPMSSPIYALLFRRALYPYRFIQIGLMRFVYNRLGISPGTAMLLLLASLLGSYVNIPVWQLPGEITGERVEFFGYRYSVPARPNGLAPSSPSIWAARSSRSCFRCSC